MYTLARLIVGDHQRVKRRFGIWERPDRWALVNFLYFIDSCRSVKAPTLQKGLPTSKPLLFSQNRPSQVGKLGISDVHEAEDASWAT